MKKTKIQLLENFLRIAPLSHALWRSTEALSYSTVKVNKPTLDVGCGFGEFAGIVFGKTEMGIDINQTDLNLALKGNMYKKVLLADAKNMPFKKASYKSVISVSVLEHIPNVEKAISEIHRVLKKDGLFIFSVPTTSLYRHLLGAKLLNFFGLESLAKKYFLTHSRSFKHVSLKSKNWWQSQLKKNGFKVVKVEGTISPTVLHLHELFLLTALPSQLAKNITGKRLILFPKLRSQLLAPAFSRFIRTDKDCDINLFIIAKKI